MIATRTRRPVVVALALALALLLLPLARLDTGTPRASAAPSTDELRVDVTGLDPVVLAPDRPLTVSGTIHNVSDTEFEDLVVLVRMAPRPLGGRDAIGTFLGAVGEDEADAGLVRATAHLPGTLGPDEEVAFSATVEPGVLEPEFTHGVLPLTVQALETRIFDGPTSQFSADNEPAPPWDPTAFIEPRGESRLPVPWATDDADLTPLPTSWLIPLTLPSDPDLVSPEAADQDAAWHEALGPDSATAAWLAEATDLPVTYAVEPGLVSPPEELVPLAEPFPGDDVAPGEPSPTPSPGTSTPAPQPSTSSRTTDGPEATDTTAGPDTEVTTAPPGEDGPTTDATTTPPGGEPEESEDPGAEDRDLLSARLREALVARADGGAAVWSLPPADLDVAALQDAGADAGTIAALLDAGTQQPLTEARTDVAWPLTSSYGDVLVTESAAAWEASALDPLAAMVLPASTLSDDDGDSDDSVSVARHTSGVPVLGYDDEWSRTVSAAIAPGATPTARLQSRQLLLAETLASHDADPGAPVVLASPRGLVPDPQARVALEQALAAAPWLDVVVADDLLEGADDAPAVSITGPGPTNAPGEGPGTDIPPGALTAQDVDDWSAAQSGLRTVTAILPRVETRREVWNRHLTEAFSSRWRTEPDVPERVLGRVADAIEDVAGGVTIVPSSVNFIADEGVIQVTVVNDLDVTVHDIGITARPSNGRLLIRSEESAPVDIAPGSRANVPLSAEARGAGEVTLETRVTAAGGQAIGDPEEIQVRVQPLGVWWWWVLGLIAVAVLIVGILRSGRVRPRRSEVEVDETGGDGFTPGREASR